MPNTTVTKAEFQAQVNQNALVDLSYPARHKQFIPMNLARYMLGTNA